MSFTLNTTEGNARLGAFSTAHGVFETPNFMPVGTRASVKGVDVERLREVGTQITLVNTYHLWERPGEELIQRLGGVHRFCNWDGPILSDSGGYQVFSLQKIREVSESGVAFQSHIDGRKLFLTPEKAIHIQESLGVDIAMVLDECPPPEWSESAIDASLNLTHRWAKRALMARKRSETQVFAITQGGGYRELRTKAAEQISQLPFDGFAIGGLSVGEPKEVMYEVLSYHPAQLPEDKIRYLMGVGTPEDIVEAVAQGVDLFDCVMPTRSGRFGRAFVNNHEEPFLNIRNAIYKEDLRPLDEQCGCVACRNYSRAYLNHLFRLREMLGPQLLSIHNLNHYLDLMRRIRESIRAGSFSQLYRDEKGRWKNAKALK